MLADTAIPMHVKVPAFRHGETTATIHAEVKVRRKLQTELSIVDSQLYSVKTNTKPLLCVMDNVVRTMDDRHASCWTSARLGPQLG